LILAKMKALIINAQRLADSHGHPEHMRH
jgi:hypothetical protein